MSQTLVGSTLIRMFHSSCPAVLPIILPISHQPKQNQADSGTAKIKVNPTILPDHMPKPIQPALVDKAISTKSLVKTCAR